MVGKFCANKVYNTSWIRSSLNATQLIYNAYSPFSLDHYEINYENYTSVVLKAREIYGSRITAPDIDHNEPKLASGNCIDNRNTKLNIYYACLDIERDLGLCLATIKEDGK